MRNRTGGACHCGNRGPRWQCCRQVVAIVRRHECSGLFTSALDSGIPVFSACSPSSRQTEWMQLSRQTWPGDVSHAFNVITYKAPVCSICMPAGAACLMHATSAGSLYCYEGGGLGTDISTGMLDTNCAASKVVAGHYASTGCFVHAAGTPIEEQQIQIKSCRQSTGPQLESTAHHAVLAPHLSLHSNTFPAMFPSLWTSQSSVSSGHA